MLWVCRVAARCATEVFSTTCAVHRDCEGWWLSGCHGSVAQPRNRSMVTRPLSSWECGVWARDYSVQRSSAVISYVRSHSCGTKRVGNHTISVLNYSLQELVALTCCRVQRFPPAPFFLALSSTCGPLDPLRVFSPTNSLASDTAGSKSWPSSDCDRSTLYKLHDCMGTQPAPWSDCNIWDSKEHAPWHESLQRFINSRMRMTLALNVPNCGLISCPDSTWQCASTMLYVPSSYFHRQPVLPGHLFHTNSLNISSTSPADKMELSISRVGSPGTL